MADVLVLCPVSPHLSDRLEARFAPVHVSELPDRDAWLAANGADIRYVLTDGHVGVPADILAGLPNLKAVSSNGVGYDAVDTDATTARGIPVSHTPNVLNAEVATSALMLFIAVWRNLEAEARHARSGDWATKDNLPLSRAVDGQTVGILGLGRIGKALAEKLAPFGCEILYHGRSEQDVPYRFVADRIAFAQACDTVISILPGGDATRHLIDADMMNAIGPDGCLVNVGRGSVVDEAALIDALQDGRLGRAALDVFEDEPRIPQALRDLPNVLLTPHIGSATVETRRAMADLAVDNLIAHAEGRGLLTPVPESAGLS